jgi:osmotically-inducible protein OsmY
MISSLGRGTNFDETPVNANATSMRRRTQLSTLAFTIVLIGGCAAYRKCGLGGCPGDAEITANVRAMFKEHPALEPPNLLTVQTFNHVVYLYGLVDTDLEREMAESVALQAAGVTKVVNSIGLSGNH